jgi:hypothetical protein
MRLFVKKQEEARRHHTAKMTPEIVRKLRSLVWEKNMQYRHAAQILGIDDSIHWSTLWNAVRGLSWKTAGGPTGGTEGRHPSRSPKNRRKKEPLTPKPEPL